MQLQVLKKINVGSRFHLLKSLVCFIAIAILGHDVSLAAQAGKNPSGACQLNSDRGSVT